MAVRNMEAINRQGKMIAQQQKNAQKMREDGFWHRVNAIRASHDDAMDFVDTVEALYKNGMGPKFEAWLKNQNVYYTNYNRQFSIGTSSTGNVYYVPMKNDVCFGWSNHGMCECYSANKDNTGYLIDRVSSQDRKYNERLTLMAERLQPFLDAFFKWLETI